MPRYINSTDKIVFSYFAAICKEEFTYEGKLIIPKPLQVSPLIFRDYTCPSHCGGCCPRFSLEYLPSEPCPDIATIIPHYVSINDRKILLYHDAQTDHKDHHCKFLDKESGRCDIHPRRPFHCDFELIRVFIGKKQNRLTQQMFGRGWQFLRIDNNRGCLCKITGVTPRSVDEVVRKLKRLKEWADHFGIVHWLNEIIPWAASGPHMQPLLLVTKEQLIKEIKI